MPSYNWQLCLRLSVFRLEKIILLYKAYVFKIICPGEKIKRYKKLKKVFKNQKVKDQKVKSKEYQD